ncbi:hypothetical protein C8J56DRAFT_861483 [Mycena floridula]|nr:hypothetical protein C8J56DRAFT_861483 [Mycena floridula]
MRSTAMELNPRPAKRQRVDSDSSDDSEMLFVPHIPLPTPSAPSSSLTMLPTPVLLISLPGLLIHPPTHPQHAHSLSVSLLAVRRCLKVPNISPDIECRGWTAVAELGMSVIGGGFHDSEDHPWAKGMPSEVETAISKGLHIAQRHPSLRAFRPHLTFLSAQLSQWQQNNRFAINQLKRLLTTFIPADPPHIVYSAHLTLISHLMSPHKKTNPPSHSPSANPDSGVRIALGAIQKFEELSVKNGHAKVTLLANVLRLRLLVSAGLWQEVPPALDNVEQLLQLDYTSPVKENPALKNADVNLAPSSSKRTKSQTIQPVSYKTFEDPFDIAMVLHVLIISVVYHTFMGNDKDTAPRLTHLHFLLDAAVLKNVKDGSVQITFPDTLPLHIQTTNSRILYVLAFLVSSVAKRDPAGRKPRRKVFATEGLAVWEREMLDELTVPPSAGLADVQDIDTKMEKMKADLYCELIGVSILRSEFEAAEQNLALLIAHVRTYELFSTFSPRITLHHAHLAHGKGNTTRALECYRVARELAEQAKDDYVRISAMAGEVALRIGLARAKGSMDPDDEDELSLTPSASMDVDRPSLGASDEEEWEQIRSLGEQVIQAAPVLGGTLRSVGKVIEACLTDEILKSKTSLKAAMNLATLSGDNHLRALTLAFLGSHFIHTAPDHALSMLSTCEQLATGLGAGPTSTSGGKDKRKRDDSLGNGPLRLWVGERFLEIFKRTAASDDLSAEAAAKNHSRIEDRKRMNKALRASMTLALQAQV